MGSILYFIDQTWRNQMKNKRPYTMAIFAAFLFLTACNSIDDSVTRSECRDEIRDATKKQEEETMAHIKNLDNPSVFYGSRVLVKKGFYKGQKGIAVREDYKTIIIKLDHFIYDNSGSLANTLRVYRSDLEKAK